MIISDHSLNRSLFEGEHYKHVRFEWTLGVKGSMVILDDLGYQYRKKYDFKDGDVLWRCSKSNALACPVRVRTRGEFILTQKNEHNHAPSIPTENIIGN